MIRAIASEIMVRPKANGMPVVGQVEWTTRASHRLGVGIIWATSNEMAWPAQNVFISGLCCSTASVCLCDAPEKLEVHLSVASL